ncbi:SHOCT domain-containing protein [Rhodococcus sp. BP-252]|uniref:SHOCT domain-containing protein n=1 Tax=Rhodococcoides kyotonense TaxID=398843 RepID=A0A177YIW4_9NOCA|nr:MULTISPECIES: SHOCT domain-containing protein [Rhodococcus]MBY6410832.1 SHOCT domain-containing protein [Rhodococcus sp. BP-320]MBY6415343.1 SHOCT domain-containing protein [Rhodococcus sp. BP-321]MBY6419958.1 SHOCT domain-containing protein [Rhodococcus sp. BP-324]MBY6425388.1 SHOCT domain-containing protein [Rhodococcus sp. BP-323]MBY6430549.1 SHOCT domain-containing protein [Rhodococcus sp. BP-322]
MVFGRGRVGRPGLLGTVARTAVVAGTANATNNMMNRRRQEREQPQQPPRQAPSPDTGDDLVGKIQKLADLRDQGILDDAEFAKAKASLLGT